MMFRTTMVWIGLACVAGACGDSASDGDDFAEDAGMDASAEVDVDVEFDRRGCSTDDCTVHYGIATVMTQVVADEDGDVEGVDLDGHITASGDDEGCGKADFVSPDGREGIDAQYSILSAAVAAVTAPGAIEAYTAGAISDGTLLNMIAIEGVDDPMDDDCVIISTFAVTGEPFLGTDGLLAPDQTFTLDEQSEIIRSECSVMKDGFVESVPFEAIINIHVLEVSMYMRLHDTVVRAQLHDDGSMDVLQGASVEVSQQLEFLTMASEAGAASEVAAGFVLIPMLADMAPDEDGVCQEISQSTSMSAVAAFLRE